jgi:molybdenum cofactor biosynthesis enzyme MoaA
MGVRDVRLTGGEPLVRRDFCALVSMLAAIEELGAGRLDERHAERFAVRTVMQGLLTGKVR